MTAASEALTLLDDLVNRARRAGADAADAILFNSTSLSLALRFGETERLERSESADLGLRVFVGQRQAIVSSSDRSPNALRTLVERVVAMARVVPEDPYAGLADPDLLARNIPDLDCADPTEPSPERIIARARAAEDAARAVQGVTNSEGAEAGWSRSDVALVGSNGFAGQYAITRHSFSVSVLAGTGTAMERDYDFSYGVYEADLDAPETVGRNAGERAVRRLNPRKVETRRVPVIFDPRVSRSLLGHLTGAISGPSIARGTSFLKDKMGEQIFAPGIRIVDNPDMKRGLRSRPFDGEGVRPQRRAIIEDGRLTTWLLDSRSARQLGLTTTGHASRGTSGPPSPAPSNLFMEPGTRSPETMIAEIKDGFYVTEMLGGGANGVTGDYSRGAAGFWIENGQLTYPVSELTIAGNVKDIFRTLEPASDLALRYGMDAPTIQVAELTVAGR